MQVNLLIQQLFKLYSEQRLSNENLTIIDKAPLIVEDIESYIKEDTDYIYIDYFNLLDSSKMFENGVDKAKYILDKLKDYTEQHNVKFLIMNNQDSNSTIEEAKEFYTSNTYTNVDCVWVLLEDKMTRIKQSFFFVLISLIDIIWFNPITTILFVAHSWFIGVIKLI